MTVQSTTLRSFLKFVPLASLKEKCAKQFVANSEFTTSKDLLDRVVDENTKYLVLDLDKTFHLGRNFGELLGWEICAYLGYGPELYRKYLPNRKKSRFLFLYRHPVAMTQYLFKGVKLWAMPGVAYFMGVKVGMRFGFLRNILHRFLGTDPVTTIHKLPARTITTQISLMTRESVDMLANVVWKRYEQDLVFKTGDFQALKKRFPKLIIVISSASPKAALDVAKQSFAIDEILYSSIEDRENPSLTPRLVHNAGHNKIENLRRRFPDFCDKDIEKVGISDTSHGEDHSWVDYFTRVVDINSPTPFPAVCAAHSPLREVHSVQVLSREEIEKRSSGQANYISRRRVKTFGLGMNIPGTNSPPAL